MVAAGSRSRAAAARAGPDRSKEIIERSMWHCAVVVVVVGVVAAGAAPMRSHFSAERRPVSYDWPPRTMPIESRAGRIRQRRAANLCRRDRGATCSAIERLQGWLVSQPDDGPFYWPHRRQLPRRPAELNRWSRRGRRLSLRNFSISRRRIKSARAGGPSIKPAKKVNFRAHLLIFCCSPWRHGSSRPKSSATSCQ